MRMGRSEQTIRYWCQDETRLGLMTIHRRKITNCGVKPIGIEQWQRDTYYLYGIVEPKTGDSFFYEFSHLDHICFEQFLKLVSEQFPDSLNIIQLDNSGAHTAGDITIPDNVLLVFQPPYSPELNPIERLWQYLKDDLAWMRYETLEALRLDVRDLLSHLCQKTIASLTGYWFILSALSVAGIN
ncbi:transposase [Leptolyngbya sp. NIES-3755]|nr:transposase [Leptolyngbya sp. NIES-3755]